MSPMQQTLPRVANYALGTSFEKPILESESLPPSDVEQKSHSTSNYGFLEWDTPNEGLYPDPSQLPGSVLSYTDPFTWPTGQKNAILALACLAPGVASYAASAYISGISQMEEEWGVGRVPLLVGLATHTAGFALAPLVLAPFSEVHGRRHVFLATFGLFNFCHLACAVCRSFPGMLVARFFLGVGGSTFSTIVGGIISDIFHAPSRGLPMALFATFGISFTGAGPLVSGFIAENLSWRWIHWVQLIFNAALMAVAAVVLKETRGSVLLSRKAEALNIWLDEIGYDGKRWKVRADEERESFTMMAKVSLTRPFRLLLTESVVFWFTLWVTFAWGIMYLLLQGVPLVFTENHGFTVSQVGLVFTAMFIGTIIALGLNTLLEHLTKKYLPSSTSKPEARLYSSCILGCCLPIGMFWFGWTSSPSQHWIFPTLAIGCTTIGIYSVYLAVFNYLADTYHAYASSAIAAQSFCRNGFGGCFPMITDAMYHKMGFAGASSFLGAVSALLAVVPWVLVFYGRRIRARSSFAKDLQEIST